MCTAFAVDSQVFAVEFLLGFCNKASSKGRTYEVSAGAGDAASFLYLRCRPWTELCCWKSCFSRARDRHNLAIFVSVRNTKGSKCGEGWVVHGTHHLGKPETSTWTISFRLWRFGQLAPGTVDHPRPKPVSQERHRECTIVEKSLFSIFWSLRFSRCPKARSLQRVPFCSPRQSQYSLARLMHHDVEMRHYYGSRTTWRCRGGLGSPLTTIDCPTGGLVDFWF
ncbi:hypothetical protein CONLIGDRAFT_100947 [Coniochaeta ligniaria NRRL 30616]|uniref:Uncharacterized protein n=1 Tax=Coniochaeta ligniaria NRRL 30616 TaxID=1408157 RepID=A0A1J7IAA5_9PEZI|nr:hypothetical protein CONLIGDRAFT_100947 [Coniochaeta ligniaria NRRL 30616]